MLTHDWPLAAASAGDTASLLRRKPFFREDMDKGELGNPAHDKLLHVLRPRYWFSAHLHVKHAAAIGDTRFLALDKIIPGRDFMQILDLPARAAPRPHDAPTGLSHSRFQLHYDAEWLAVLRSTQGFYPRHVSAQMPAPDRPVPFLPVRAPDTPAPADGPRDDMAVARFDFRPTREEQAEVLRLLPDMAIPDNFSKVRGVETQPTRIHAHFLIFSDISLRCSSTGASSAAAAVEVEAASPSAAGTGAVASSSSVGGCPRPVQSM